MTTDYPETFVEWMQQSFNAEELADLVLHGAVSGFGGLIYSNETRALYERYQDEIWQMLAEDADDKGITILQLIIRFGMADSATCAATFENLLVCDAAERIAFQLSDK